MKNKQKKINKIDEPLANLTKLRREKIQINKIITKKRISQQTPMKFRGSLENTLKTYIQINWKV
jgi:hypothetical protein